MDDTGEHITPSTADTGSAQPGAPDLQRLAELIRLVETRGLTELTVEENGYRYTVRGSGSAVASPAPERYDQVQKPRASGTPKLDRSTWKAITSPMVGVFYRSPAPGEPPFVEVGDPVEEGQTIGIIEAMKVFSEIPCEVSGVVAEIVVEDGQLVRADEPLMYLAPPSDIPDEGEDHE